MLIFGSILQTIKEGAFRMNKSFKSFLSLFLAVVICFTSASPVFAANEKGVTYNLTLDHSTLTKSNSDQTVKMSLAASKPIKFASFEVYITNDSPLILSAISSRESQMALSGGNYNLANGKISWESSDAEDITNVTRMIDVTFTVPANTPAGTYSIGFSGLELSEEYGKVWESNGTGATTLTITDPNAPTAGYSANISTVDTSVTKGDSAKVNIGIAGATTYNATEVKVSYDATKVTFNQTASTLGTATVKAAGGVVTLEDYGADKNTGNAVYTLAFDAIADGNAAFGLTSAMVSDKASATKKDLAAATVTVSSLTVTIEKPVFSITLPAIFDGATTVTEGENYTFSVADGSNFDYSTVTATMGGTSATVTDNGNGTYTIANVTGALVITGTRTAKSYSAAFSGNAAADITNAASTATYGVDYTFTMPAVDGWAYQMESVTIGGVSYTGYSVEGNVYTIPGTAITGNIAITVTKSQTIASVTVEGSGAGAAAGYTASATIGEAYTLTIVPVAGYDYTVTATMGGATATVVNNNDNTYTIENVTGNIIFTVAQAANVDGVSVSKYLSLNGTNMWLVKNTTVLATGSTATYDGTTMFWSEKYNAYCTLVIADELTSETAAAKVGIAVADKDSVSYGMDVNMSNKVDANDAQFIYNMYNAMYNEFSADVTVEKFLRADVNGDAVVNVADATAVISGLLA